MIELIEKTKNSGEYDVLIIGGGPGGLSSALWCSELGSKAIILEKASEFGGQLLRTFNPICNYLGIKAKNGRELRDQFLRSTENAEFDRLSNALIVKVDLSARIVTIGDGTHLTSKNIIIATGVRRRTLGVAGETEFHGRGILESGAEDPEIVRSKTVAIVGGGDAALENALILSKTAANVIIIHRGNQFSARPEFIEQVRNIPKINVCFGSEVTEITGDESVKGVRVKARDSGEINGMSIDALLLRIGVVPNTELFRDQVELDGAGYILIDSNCSTNLQGIYAVGDVASPLAPTIANASGQGSVAAKNIAQNRLSKKG